MQNFNLENVDCHATLAMIEKRWGFPRRTLRALLGMTKNAQSGRSMIEMLGVLAIIGVLSVGGIAGYSKAMMKYRINKTIEQITLIAGNIRTFFSTQGNYEGLMYVTGDKIIRKAKLIPEEMWDTCDDNTPCYKSAIGAVSVSASPIYDDNSDVYARKSYKIYMYDLPREACIEISTMNWTSNSGNRMVAIAINPSTVDEVDGGFIDACTTSGQLICSKDLPVDVDKAVQLCNDDNSILLKFY